MKVFLLAILFVPGFTQAQTPKLDITLQHISSGEQEQRALLERLARQYDLSKYTITQKIVIDEQAINHSHPVLTLNLRFVANDDRALSLYIHEQAHWLLMKNYRPKTREMLAELLKLFPNIDISPPNGDGKVGSSYIHLMVIMLEWQALENLIGVTRAKAVLEFKRSIRYKELFGTVIDHRKQMEDFLKRYGVKW